MFHILWLRCVKYAILKRPLSFYECTFIAQRSPTCFGHACGHLQGGGNNNTNIIVMCLNHTKV